MPGVLAVVMPLVIVPTVIVLTVIVLTVIVLTVVSMAGVFGRRLMSMGRGSLMIVAAMIRLAVRLVTGMFVTRMVHCATPSR